MAQIQLNDLTKKYSNDAIVGPINFTVYDKEFIVLVGPSGCGKTTTLRMVAGLEEVTYGDIYIGDRDVTYVHPKDRDIAMVFQNYALYPHMNVFKNMAFGLQQHKVPKHEINRRVKETARILEIEDLLDRKPRQISGGQCQRVAMGRAIVRKPKAFLFDEPLSNLDAKLRIQMRGELIKLHEKIETTSIYVTHDQVEAMTLANRIVIMNQGRIMQIGDPMSVYHRPKNFFVAGFIGSPTMNFFEGCVIEAKGSLFIQIENLNIAIPESIKKSFLMEKDHDIVFGIRPEHIHGKDFKGLFPGGEQIRATVDVVETLGSHINVLASRGPLHFTACLDSKTFAKAHTEMDFVFDMNYMHLFDKSTGESLLGDNSS